MNHTEVFNRLVKSQKPKRIVASFSRMSDLTEEQKKHFSFAPYLWKSMAGNIYGGVLLDESLEYVHMVLASERVVLSLINKQSAVLTK